MAVGGEGRKKEEETLLKEQSVEIETGEQETIVQLGMIEEVHQPEIIEVPEVEALLADRDLLEEGTEVQLEEKVQAEEEAVELDPERKIEETEHLVKTEKMTSRMI